MPEMEITRESAVQAGLSPDITSALEDVFDRLAEIRAAYHSTDELETALFAIAW